MYIFNSFNHVPLKTTVIEALKAKGVKYKLPKKVKEDSSSGIAAFGPKVFQTHLQNMAKSRVKIKNGQATVEVPDFLVEACGIVDEKLDVEGIFRKGGSAVKQRELKTLINSGKRLDDSCHVVDVCNLIKLFFRELPEPLLPLYCHEMLLSCLLLQGEAAQKDALLLSCLLLQIDHLSVLTYFMEFLWRISQAAEANKMDSKNLAIVFTPSLMPLDAKIKLSNNLTINHHIAVIEMLINCANELGCVPMSMVTQATQRTAKKRRSASITRMFTGIKKMVVRAPSPTHTTPTTNNAPRKRKSVEVMPPAVTVKRRREVAETTPNRCRMGGYSRSSLRLSDNLLREKLESPERRKSEGEQINVNKRESTVDNEVPISTDTCKQGLKSSKSTSHLIMSKKKSLERKLSNWKKRRSSPKKKSISPLPNASNKENEELVTISKREYEDMKTRVSSMEKLLEEREKEGNVQTDPLSLESENLATRLDKNLRLNVEASQSSQPAVNTSPKTAVQVAFERTVVQSEQLGPQISSNVRLRWSTERRVARSPSERKIGSIRRRSRELARSNSAGARTTLQRGRPNSRQTGLRSPRALSDPKRTKQQAQSPSNMKWKPGSSLPMSPGIRKIFGTPDRRDSIACIRKRNVGMVQAKAKFFDSLNHSVDAESDRSNRSMELRLQTVKAELQSRPPTIKAALTTATVSGLKTPLSQARAMPRLRGTPLKALPGLSTPQRRSPRILARSLSHHVAFKS